MRLLNWLCRLSGKNKFGDRQSVLSRRRRWCRSLSCRGSSFGDSHLESIALHIEAVEPRALLSASHDIVGLTALRSDPVFAGIDGKLDNGERIGVAVIDTGAFATHADLRDQFVVYFDAVRGFQSSNVNDARDPVGHGTHVAGTVLGGFSAQLNDQIGMAPQAGLVAIRGLPADGERLPAGANPVLTALNWVLQNQREFNIKVVNMSLGFGNFDTGSLPVVDAIANVISSLEQVGVTVVSASGNSFGRFNVAGAGYPAIFSTLSVANTVPEILPGQSVLAGAGIGDTGTFLAADFSPEVNAFSPTSQRSTLDNQVAAPGTYIVSTYNNGGYETMNGTSMASPLVAGAVTLMQDAAFTFGGRFLQPSEVANLIRTTADVFADSPDPDTYRIPLDNEGRAIVPRLPNGNIDFSQLEDLLETGRVFLRVNVQRAVAAVRDLVTRGTTPEPIPDPARRTDDTNHTLSTAVTVPPLDGTSNFRFGGRIGRDGQVNVGADDVDLFRIDLKTPGRLNIVTAPIAGGDDFDPFLRIFDADGSQIAFNDDADFPTNVYPALQTALLPASTYHYCALFEVSQADSVGVGGLRVRPVSVV